LAKDVGNNTRHMTKNNS